MHDEIQEIFSRIFYSHTSYPSYYIWLTSIIQQIRFKTFQQHCTADFTRENVMRTVFFCFTVSNSVNMHMWENEKVEDKSLKRNPEQFDGYKTFFLTLNAMNECLCQLTRAEWKLYIFQLHPAKIHLQNVEISGGGSFKPEMRFPHVVGIKIFFFVFFSVLLLML